MIGYPITAVSAVAQIARTTNRLNASALTKYVRFHCRQKNTITANIVPVCSITSSSVISGDDGSSPEQLLRNHHMRGARNRKQFGESLDDRQDQNFKQRHPYDFIAARRRSS